MVEAEQAAAKGGSKALKWVLGCGCSLLLVTALCAGLAYWGFGTLVNWMLTEAEASIAELNLPDEQVESIRGEFERIRTGYEDGRIDAEEVGEFIAEFEGGSLVAVALVQVFDVRVLAPSDLPADEKEAGHRTLERLASGIGEGSVSHFVAFRLFGDEGDSDGGSWDERWADPEALRETLAEAHAAVETAGVAADVGPIDVAGELGEMVDRMVD